MSWGDDLAQLDEILCSYLSSHAGDCCTDAQTLVVGRFTTHLHVGSALAAVAAEVHWAPSRWPVWWCDVDADDPHGDCGVIAAIASSVLTRYGIEHHRGRAAIEPAPAVPAHWSSTWQAAASSEAWIGPTLVHHEVIRIDDRWWDPTEGSWFTGAGSMLLAGRVVGVRAEDERWTVAAPTDAR